MVKKIIIKHQQQLKTIPSLVPSAKNLSCSKVKVLDVPSTFWPTCHNKNKMKQKAKNKITPIIMNNNFTNF